MANTTNKKKASAVAAVAVAAALALGGTFAWQGYQSALNEASDVVNPGGRLHDDFNGSNKDVYVENFADDPIFTRVRLSEYFEIVMNPGTDAEASTPLLGYKEVVTDDEGNEANAYTYETFKNYASLDGDAVAAGVVGEYVAGAPEGEAGYSWWTWHTGGETVYMPTFNKNKDSMEADLNGTYRDAVGGISERDDDQYVGYDEYEVDEEITANAVYDADSNGIEDDGVTTVEETHTATWTDYGTLISMEDWLGLVDAWDSDDDGVYDSWDSDLVAQHGNYWVYDTDGWVYWSGAIAGGETTGLLLDGIELNQVMDDSWYYAINVEAQFVTENDLGAEDGTGFFADGEAPSDGALVMLQAIGAMGEEAVEEEPGEPMDVTEYVTFYYIGEDGTEEEVFDPSYQHIDYDASKTVKVENQAVSSAPVWTVEPMYDGEDASDMVELQQNDDGSVLVQMSGDYAHELQSFYLKASFEDNTYAVLSLIISYPSLMLNLEKTTATPEDGSDFYIAPGDSMTFTVQDTLSNGIAHNFADGDIEWSCEEVANAGNFTFDGNGMTATLTHDCESEESCECLSWLYVTARHKECVNVKSYSHDVHVYRNDTVINTLRISVNEEIFSYVEGDASANTHNITVEVSEEDDYLPIYVQPLETATDRVEGRLTEIVTAGGQDADLTWQNGIGFDKGYLAGDLQSFTLTCKYIDETDPDFGNLDIAYDNSVILIFNFTIKYV